MTPDQLRALLTKYGWKNEGAIVNAGALESWAPPFWAHVHPHDVLVPVDASKSDVPRIVLRGARQLLEWVGSLEVDARYSSEGWVVSERVERALAQLQLARYYLVRSEPDANRAFMAVATALEQLRAEGEP